MDLDGQIKLGHLLLQDRKCRVCGEVKNLVDIPIRPLIHIQNIAPGPPIEIATATPAIFPIPTVAERAVVKA